MASVAILTGNHLCHNPRVIKEAVALSEAGHKVMVLGAWLDPSLKKRDQDILREAAFQFVPVIDFPDPGFRASLARFRYRAVVKAARTAFRFLGVESTPQLGYAESRLRAVARKVSADLYIAHSEAGLVAASALIEQQRRVGVDMEDWFSEDLLPAQQEARPLRLLRQMERNLLRRSVFSTCPSRAMSEALAREYGCRPPVVVYNAFPWADRAHLDRRRVDRTDLATPSIHWVSQTLGPGRGLEDLFAALPLLTKPVQIHLRGHPVGGFENWLEAQLPPKSRARVFVHGLVPNDELLSRIAEHDIGFAGEQDYCRSRNLTVTNKILHYLCGGLAIVASKTAGQAEVASLAPGAVFLYPIGDQRALAARIEQLLGSSESLIEAKKASLVAAEQLFCWEKQAQTMVKLFEDAIARSFDH